MKYYFAKKLRMIAYIIRSKVHKQSVLLSLSRISSPAMDFKYKWYNTINNISESIFYKCDRICCEINGKEPFVF